MTTYTDSGPGHLDPATHRTASLNGTSTSDTVDPLSMDQPEEIDDMARGTHASTTNRGQHVAETDKPQGRVSRRVNQIGTLIAFGIASALSAGGMWVFMEHTLHMNHWQRIGGFAIFEVLMLTSGLRARALRLRSPDASRWNVDGLAVWAFAAASGVFSASETTSVWGALARLIIAMSSAFALERLIAEERAAKFNKRRKPRWLQKLLVRLGWHDPQSKTLIEIDEARRLARLATLGHEALTLPDPKKRAAAAAKYQRALAKTNERVDIATDPAKVAKLRANVALLMHGLEQIAPTKVASADPWAASARADKTTRQTADGDQTADRTDGRTGQRTDQTGRRTADQTGPGRRRTATTTVRQTAAGQDAHGQTAVDDAKVLRLRWPHGLPSGANALVRRAADDGGLGWGASKTSNAIKAYLDAADQTVRVNGSNGSGHNGLVLDRTGLTP
jgi:hypothetical protein